jgi:hypothetical protein
MILLWLFLYLVVLIAVFFFGKCRTDIILHFLNQDPDLLRSYIANHENSGEDISLLGLLVSSSPFIWSPNALLFGRGVMYPQGVGDWRGFGEILSFTQSTQIPSNTLPF